MLFESRRFVNLCIGTLLFASDHEGDSILMERWMKEYAIDDNMLVPV